MKKFILSLLIIFFVLALAIPAFAAAAPVPGNPSPKMDWDVKYAKALKLEAIESPRQNASGDKITSNAHAADFPGLYFYWNDKQKDDGVLLVDPAVFNLFTTGQFILTAKNSNAYWGYVIKPDLSHKIGDLYAYGIPRNFMYLDKKGKQVKEELKNINMVFIDGTYKSAYVELIKKWETKTEDGELEFVEDAELTALINFTGLKLGVNEIKISDFNTAAKGKKVTVAEIIDEEKFEYAYSKVNGVDKPVKGKAVLFNKVYETAYEVSLSAAADTRHIVEFGNRVKPDKYKLTLEKHVNGTPFGEWAWKVVIEDETLTFDELYEILASVSFLVYEADEEGNYDETAVPVSTGVLAEEGLIEFLPFELKPGWYVIVEVLEGKAAEIFDVVDPLLIEVGENGNLINISDFDYKAFYTVVNGYGGGYTLGYQGLNNTGDIFYIGVKNAETGIEYPSICANACSTNFAGEGGVGCSGYLVSIEDMPNDVPREDFLKAYNYMYEKYGDLNDIRPVVQIITWALLGAIDVGSEAFDNINWAAVEAGTAAIKGVPDAEDMVYDVFDNYKDFQISNGEIADVIFLVCDKHDEDHDFVKCQPQLVPVYGKLVFNNKTKEDEGFPECPVSFNKVILGGMYNNVAPSLGGYVFYFDLYKLDQGIWHMVNDVDAPFVTDVEGSVLTPDLELGSYKFVERPHGVWSIEQQYANGIFFEIRQSVENPRVAEVVWVGGTDANGNKTVVNTPILGPGNGSVTATNDSKNPLIVPNSNHFNYAKLDRADLEKGVVLDMVVGNGNRLVGNALVKLVDGKIVITFNGTGGSFGAIAFNQLPNPGNGNIHSMNEFSHNSQAVITCPPGNTIYLYIHSNSIRFYREILAW